GGSGSQSDLFPPPPPPPSSLTPAFGRILTDDPTATLDSVGITQDRNEIYHVPTLAGTNPVEPGATPQPDTPETHTHTHTHTQQGVQALFGAFPGMAMGPSDAEPGLGHGHGVHTLRDAQGNPIGSIGTFNTTINGVPVEGGPGGSIDNIARAIGQSVQAAMQH
ncbi:hypothetical protein KIPB_013431, partial [Kipferlia bialata]